MAQFTCPYGHLDAEGQPIVHVSRQRCELYRQLLKEGKIDSTGTRLDVKLPPLVPGTPPTTPGATPGTPPAEGTKPPEAKKESWSQRLRSGLVVKYQRTGTTTPEQRDRANEEADKTWLVNEDTVIHFWELIFSFLETGLNLVCKAIKIPHIPEEVFQIDPGQKYIFKTALRGLTTKILRDVFLAKSPADADRIVAGLGGVLGFGLMAFKIVGHFILYVPQSPRIKEWRAKRATLIARRKAEHDAVEALKSKGTPEGEPGTPGSGRVALPGAA